MTNPWTRGAGGLRCCCMAISSWCFALGVVSPPPGDARGRPRYNGHNRASLREEESAMPPHSPYVERVVDLTDPSRNIIYNLSLDEARAAVASGDPARVRAIDGQF